MSNKNIQGIRIRGELDVTSVTASFNGNGADIAGIISSSYAVTSSYAENANVTFDTSSLVDLTSNQTITGIKNIANYLAFTNSATVDIGVPSTFPSVYDYNGENSFAIASRLNNESNYFAQTLLKNGSNGQKMFIGIVSGSSYSSTTPSSFIYFSNSIASIYANQDIYLNADWIGLYSTSSIEINPQGGLYINTPVEVDVLAGNYISLYSNANVALFASTNVTINATLDIIVSSTGYTSFTSGDEFLVYAPNDITITTDALLHLTASNIFAHSSGYIDIISDGGLSFVAGSGSITPSLSDFVFKSSTPRFLFSGSNPYSNVYIVPESDNAYVVKKFVNDNFTSASTFTAFSQSVSSSLANISLDTSSLLTITDFNSYSSSVIVPFSNSFVAVSSSFVSISSSYNSFSSSFISFSASVSSSLASSGGGGAVYSASIGDNSATVFTVTHNLNKSNIFVTVRENPTGSFVYPDIFYSSSNVLALTFVSAPTTNQYLVSVLGA